MPQQNTSKPVRTIRCANITASVWKTKRKKNGQTVARHSVRIQKRFRREGGDYENTDYYFPEDLPKLALVAEEAFRFITLRESKNTEETTES